MERSCKNCIHRNLCQDIQKQLRLKTPNVAYKMDSENCKHYINLYLYGRQPSWRLKKYREHLVVDEEKFEQFLKSRGIKFQRTEDSYILERPLRVRLSY